MSARVKPETMAGAASGMVTLTKALRGVAPRVLAAFSRLEALCSAGAATT